MWRPRRTTYDYTLNTQVNPSALAVDLTGNLPSVSAAPGGYLEQRDNFFWAAGMDDTQQNEATQFATRLSLAYAIDSGWFQSFKAGVRYTDREATNRDTGYNWQPISQWWQGDAQGNWPGHLASMDNYITGDSTLFDFSDFFRGQANLPGSLWVASDSLVKNLNNNGAVVQSALGERLRLGAGQLPGRRYQRPAGTNLCGLRVAAVWS